MENVWIKIRGMLLSFMLSDPNRQHPSQQYFPYIQNRYWQEGNWKAEQWFIINEDVEINVLATVEVDKTVSSREIGQELNMSHESARKILKRHEYRAFKYYQYYYVDDGDRLVVFRDGLLQIQRTNRNIINFILFSDESQFTKMVCFILDQTKSTPNAIFKKGFETTWLGRNCFKVS